MDGIINVLKPPNMTSHDVVGFLRRITRIKKIGHTGTLDPNAAGVLPVCIGKATRVAEFFNDEAISKKYRAELKLGEKTDTQDAYGEIIETDHVSNINREDIISAITGFTGEIEQIPPMYSAKKVNGKKLYELARQGIEVERKSRIINIYDIEVVSTSEDRYLFDVKCSSGTYIRTLCNDICEKLNTVGHMSFLLRTEVGKFSINDAYTLDEIVELHARGCLEENLHSIDYPLEFMKKIEVEKSCFNQILNGVKIPVERADYIEESRIDEGTGKNEYRVYCDDIFIGVGFVEDSLIKMRKVLTS